MSSNTAAPRVSIGMPVYNGEAQVKEALDSLLSQTFTNFELIVSDNASTDNTAAIVQAYAAKDARVRYHRQAENIGATNNFNWVLNAASAEYYMWAAHDDVWEPGFIEEMVKQLDRDESVELAFCLFDTLSFDGKSRGRAFDLHALCGKDRVDTLYRFLRHHESCGKANLFYGLLRRATLVRMGGLKLWGDGVWGADMLFVFSILLQGKLSLVDRQLFHKRASPDAPSRAPDRNPTGWREGLAHRKEKTGIKRQKALDRLGYWAGYDRLLKQAENIDTQQNARLQRALKSRRRKYQRNFLRHNVKYKVLDVLT